MPRLTITAPNREPRVYEFRDGRIFLGRSADCTVSIDDPAADPRHCVLERTDGGGFKIVDLETRNGTEVNGAKVNVRVLAHGDRIRVGATTVLFESAEPADQTDVLRLRPRRRRRLLRRRRITLPKAAPQVFTNEDLRVVIQSLVEQNGPATLDEVRKMLDQFYEEHQGAPLFETLSDVRDGLYRMM